MKRSVFILIVSISLGEKDHSRRIWAGNGERTNILAPSNPPALCSSFQSQTILTETCSHYRLQGRYLERLGVMIAR